MKPHSRLLVTSILLGALVVPGCQPAAAGLSDADKAALQERAQQTMKTMNAKDYQTWGTDLTDDAEWLGPNAPVVKGRDAIVKNMQAGPVISDLVLTPVDVDGRGDLAYVRGDYTLNVTPPGAPGPVADKGKYIEIWRKQADGSWKCSKVIIASDLPPAGPPPAPATK